VGSVIRLADVPLVVFATSDNTRTALLFGRSPRKRFPHFVQPNPSVTTAEQTIEGPDSTSRLLQVGQDEKMNIEVGLNR
jgi:hypothetical protein